MTILKSRCSAGLAVVVCGIALALTGCVKTVTHKVAKFTPAEATGPTTRPVPEAAVYKVKVKKQGEDEYHGVDGTRRLLRAGEVVGFRRGEDGVLYAMAGKEEVALGQGEDWERLVWFTQRKKQTQFSREVNKVADTAANVAGVVGMIAVEGAVNAALGKDDCDDESSDLSARWKEVKRMRERDKRK
jgi:hypothetical protein